MEIDWQDVGLIFGTVATCIGLYLGCKRFLLKWGIEIRGYYDITSSVASKDKFVSIVRLENLKDRAVTIFAIYLRIGPNVYLLLENFDESPLILKGFETYSKNFDPVELYSVNLRQVRINELLSNRRVRCRLVLSTSLGKYVVKKPLFRWSPISLYFKNHLTFLLQPLRLSYGGKSFSGNVKFVIEFPTKMGETHFVPVYPDDHEIQKFQDFRLTEEAIDSKENLEKFLLDLQAAGTIQGGKITVHDIQRNRLKVLKNIEMNPRELPRISPWVYFVVGPFTTRKSQRELARKNDERRKQHAADSAAGDGEDSDSAV